MLALTIALALVEVGLAAEMLHGSRRTDFSGRWTPDFARWEGIERLLDLQDAPWIVRQAVGDAATSSTATRCVSTSSQVFPASPTTERCRYIAASGIAEGYT